MRVLMTVDTVGGVWTYALELARALAVHDVEVTLATMGPRTTVAQRHAATAVPNVTLVESGLALEWMPHPWRDVDAAGDWLGRLAAQLVPDVVHLNGFVHASLPFDAPTVVVAHADVCTWHRACRGVAAPPEWDEYRRRVARGLAAADVVVAPTRAILDAILEEHQVLAPGRVIPNGRSTTAPVAPKLPFVLAAGRVWDEAKGLDALAACAGEVPWPIWVAGPTLAPDGTSSVRWRDAARVHLLGEMGPELLGSWMARASIFAAPARYEPFGLCALEAALSGCALVVSSLDTLHEVWGDAAIYVPPASPHQLGRALRSLVEDPGRRDAMAVEAHRRALRYTPTAMATAYRALYDELVAPALAGAQAGGRALLSRADPGGAS
ncbi:MAG: glycosyltransferase family 4 protein [Deltaproteobacteria bacterium]|nr:glycosyltransferase family 4 protein [Kofleriaceae bacterium]